MRAVQASATGEAFLDAARSVGSMLMRHSLSAVSVWWVPNMVLRFAVLGMSATMGVLAYFVSLAAWQSTNRHQAGMVRPPPLDCCTATRALALRLPALQRRW